MKPSPPAPSYPGFQRIERNSSRKCNGPNLEDTESSGWVILSSKITTRLSVGLFLQHLLWLFFFPDYKVRTPSWKDKLDPVAQPVKNLPAMQETWVQSLGCEDPLEKEMATHSIILAWEIPCTEEPGRYSPWGCKSRTQLCD